MLGGMALLFALFIFFFVKVRLAGGYWHGMTLGSGGWSSGGSGWGGGGGGSSGGGGFSGGGGSFGGGGAGGSW
jgi:uncharacterized protein